MVNMVFLDSKLLIYLIYHYTINTSIYSLQGKKRGKKGHSRKVYKEFPPWFSGFMVIEYNQAVK